MARPKIIRQTLLQRIEALERAVKALQAAATTFQIGACK